MTSTTPSRRTIGLGLLLWAALGPALAAGEHPARLPGHALPHERVRWQAAAAPHHTLAYLRPERRAAVEIPRRVALDWVPVSRGYAGTLTSGYAAAAAALPVPTLQVAGAAPMVYAPPPAIGQRLATGAPMSLAQALAAFQQGDYASALPGFEFYAAQGSAVAQNHLAAMYQNGLGVAIDLPQAAAWYLKSASQGNANGQYRVGRAYEQGLGVPVNPALARYWYRMAADQGQQAAQYSLRRVEGPPAGVPATAAEAPSTLAPPLATTPVPAALPAPAIAMPTPASGLPEQLPLASGPGRRLALVIGNASYPRGMLKNPLHDADDMTRALRQSGFSVMELRDASLQQMRSAVRQFGDRMAANDVGLVYYSGHGVEIQGHNYFVPVNADIQREDEVVEQSLDVGMILDKMASAQKGVNILIVDACRDNPFGHGLRSASVGLGSMEPPSGTLIAYSTSPGKVAADGEGRNSPFTHHLLLAMQEPNKPIEQVFKEVRRAVQQETRNAQIPWETTSLSGDFFFRGQGQRVAMP